MKKIIILIVFLLLAQYTYAEVTIIRKQIARDVQNLEPVGVDVKFNKNVGKLFCFTEVSTDQYPTNIVHLWLYNNNIMAEIPLSVNANKWRTYSSKIISPQWVGKWKVEIYTSNNKLIDEISFEIVDE